MLMLVSGATRDITPDVGELIVPRQWNDPASLRLTPGRWAMDNGAFAGFDEGAFVRMLERFAPYPGCLFVVAPDAVADAAATLARWPFWSRLIRGLGLPPAFVLQDGITPERVPTDAAALFVGGSTEFKESAHAASICAYGKARGLWVHVGRVNSRRRLKLIAEFGADSFDGTGFSRHGATNIPKGLRWVEQVETDHQQQPALEWGGM